MLVPELLAQAGLSHLLPGLQHMTLNCFKALLIQVRAGGVQLAEGVHIVRGWSGWQCWQGIVRVCAPLHPPTPLAAAQVGWLGCEPPPALPKFTGLGH